MYTVSFASLELMPATLRTVLHETSSGSRCLPLCPVCCERVCPAADASQIARVARVIFDGLGPGLAGMWESILSVASFA